MLGIALNCKYGMLWRKVGSDSMTVLKKRGSLGVNMMGESAGSRSVAAACSIVHASPGTDLLPYCNPRVLPQCSSCFPHCSNEPTMQ